MHMLVVLTRKMAFVQFIQQCAHIKFWCFLFLLLIILAYFLFLTWKNITQSKSIMAFISTNLFYQYIIAVEVENGSRNVVDGEKIPNFNLLTLVQIRQLWVQPGVQFCSTPTHQRWYRPVLEWHQPLLPAYGNHWSIWN